MRKPLPLAFLLAALAWAAPAPAQPIPAVPGDYEIVRVTAKVSAVDPATRLVTLTLEDGSVLPVTAGPNVINFDRIAVGDTVVATYAAGLSFELSKAGAKTPGVKVTEGVAAAIPGAMPAGGVMRQTAVTTLITAVDPAANTVSVVAQDGGSIHTLHVQDPGRQKLLPQVHPGQLLTVTYTQAIGLAVEQAAK